VEAPRQLPSLPPPLKSGPGIYYSPHSDVDKGGLLLHASHIPWSVCPCVLGTPVSPAKVDELT